LEFEPDLAADLDPGALQMATAELVAPVIPIEWRTRRERWGPAEPRGHLGLLILQGLLLREVSLAGSASAEVLGEGDLLRPWDVDGEFQLPMPSEVSWTVLAPCEVAVLGTPFLRRGARWPEVLARLTGRTVARAKSLGLHDALTNLKHVETRLLVQFWHLAERWGRVGPECIAIPVPLTHEMLAKLVGATRPSVTTGLGRLAARNLLVRDSGGAWRLAHDSREALAPLPVEAGTRLVA
jgi:CRP/FNR family cyclic AMP-dependent transcriptional regulator